MKRTVKTQWCRHISWSVFVIGHGYGTTAHGMAMEVPDGWKACPICLSPRPTTKPKPVKRGKV